MKKRKEENVLALLVVEHLLGAIKKIVKVSIRKNAIL